MCSPFRSNCLFCAADYIMSFATSSPSPPSPRLWLSKKCSALSCLSVLSNACPTNPMKYTAKILKPRNAVEIACAIRVDVYSPLGLPLQWLLHVSGSGRKQQTNTLRPSKQEGYYTFPLSYTLPS